MTPSTPPPDRFLPLRPLTLQILLSLADGERHGYAISADIASRSAARLPIRPGNLYRSLTPLLDDGLIAESDRRPAPDLDDARRRYYRMTPLGRRVLEAELARLATVLRDARAIRALAGRSKG